MVKEFKSCLLFLSACIISISASDNGLRCNCDDEGFWSIENIMECQKVCDFLIAVAYFSIPIELLCFVSCSNIPFKWVLVQFIAFIVLCGMTHLLNFWTYGPHSFQLMLALTIFKFLTALVSFATAITLITLIPLLLKVKVREFMLWKKTWDLDQEVGIIKKKKEAASHVRMLTREIRKSLDRHTILYTTLVELSKTLDLKNCAVWMPNSARSEIHLTHELNERNYSSLQNSAVSIHDPDVRDIKTSNGVKILDPESALAVASGGGAGEAGSVAAIRMPMLRVSNFKGGTPEFRAPACYAILVLVLPDEQNRSWSEHELEIIEVVADQVAVALSHASVLEESQLMREKLVVQNRALQQAKQDALMASQARDAFQMVISNGLRRPMHSILGLLSLLQDEKLSNEQQLPVDTMLKASGVLSTLITDVIDTSMKDSGRFPFEIRPFQLHSTVKQVACLSKCLCAYRDCSFDVDIDKSLQNHVIGDERRVFQVILHMVGSLLNGIKQGGALMLLRVYTARGSPLRNDQKWGGWGSSQPDGFTFVRFDVSIMYIKSQMEDNRTVTSSSGRQYLAGVEESMSFSACKKLAQLMQGDIWVSSNPEGFDETMAFILRFQAQHVVVSAITEQHESSNSNSHLRGLRILLADADDLNRTVTTKLLEKLGCIVASVSSGYECITALGNTVSSYQIVLLDLHLADIDGCEVVRRIRKFRSRSWPVIIGLNAGDGGEMRDKWSQIGINGVIQKPVSFKEIGFELKRFIVQANRLSS